MQQLNKLTDLLLGVGIIAGNTGVTNSQISLLGSGKVESYIRGGKQRLAQIFGVL